MAKKSLKLLLFSFAIFFSCCIFGCCSKVQHNSPDAETTGNSEITSDSSEAEDTTPSASGSIADTTENPPESVTDYIQNITEETKNETVTSQDKNDPPKAFMDQLSDKLGKEKVEGYLKTISEVELGTGKAPKDYFDNIVFLGDSTTYGLYAYGYVDYKQVWVPKNGTLALFRATTDLLYDATDGSELTLYEMALKHKPKYLIITLGVNGVSFLSEEAFTGYYESVILDIKKASPKTKIILQTIYPLCANYDTSNGINNTVIFNGNGLIAEIAKRFKLPFLNTASEMVDENGYRPQEYTNGDGLHLSPAGFEFVLSYIASHPYK